MRFFTSSVLAYFIALTLIQAPALAADAELDALSLQSDMGTTAEAVRESRLFIEGAIGNASQRYLPSSRNIARASVDFWHSTRLAPGLRAVFSDRLDYLYPRDGGVDSTVNSLREAYLSWQAGGENTVLELGRINLRYGPGYGYNPTDFFRDGSLRVLTSADPFALRQNRLGSVMLRAQRLWMDGSLSIAYSPKLADHTSPNGLSLDLGATNNRNRALIALASQFSQSVNTQVLLYKDDGMTPTLGANLTALLSDAAVAHMEWSRGKEPDLFSRALALPEIIKATRNRFVAGVTYTTVGKLSVTAEYQYNGFAITQSDEPVLAAALTNRLAYFREALRLQDLASRRAYLVYITQKSLWLKDLDLTAYLRLNSGDGSRLAWLELRHHWPNLDVSLQLLQGTGRSGSEFGILPDRRIVQVLGTYFF